MEGEIPDWKRGAVTLSDKEVEDERGFMSRMGSKVKGRLDQTDAAK